MSRMNGSGSNGCFTVVIIIAVIIGAIIQVISSPLKLFDSLTHSNEYKGFEIIKVLKENENSYPKINTTTGEEIVINGHTSLYSQNPENFELKVRDSIWIRERELINSDDKHVNELYFFNPNK